MLNPHCLLCLVLSLFLYGGTTENQLRLKWGQLKIRFSGQIEIPCWKVFSTVWKVLGLFLQLCHENNLQAFFCSIVVKKFTQFVRKVFVRSRLPTGLTEVTETISYVCTEKNLTIKEQFHYNLEQPASNFSIFCPFACWKYFNSIFSRSRNCYLSQHLSIWEIFRFQTNQISWKKWWNAKTPAINISLVYL